MDEMMQFRKNALLGGLCKEWDGMWAACHDDKERLIRLVLMCQSAPYFATFCYNGRGLTKEYCKENFSEYINGRVYYDCDNVEGFSYQMFVDPDDKNIQINSDVSQFLWCNDVNLYVYRCKCPRMYVSNSSVIHITLEGYNEPHVYLFDNSKVIIDDADETSGIIVYGYSDECSVDKGTYCLTNNIKFFRKELRL